MFDFGIFGWGRDELAISVTQLAQDFTAKDAKRKTQRAQSLDSFAIFFSVISAPS